MRIVSLLQVKSKSQDNGSAEKIELQLLASRPSKLERDVSTVEDEPQQGRRESLKLAEPLDLKERGEVSPVLDEPSSRAEARSRSVEDLPKKPKTYKFRDSKSSDV